MKTVRPRQAFDWRASSLAWGDDVSALGDHYGLYAHNKDKWLMEVGGGPASNNGDATVLSNLLDFAAKVGPDAALGGKASGVDLYSHDAGIDVSNDFNDQENANAKVHLGCALAGLMTLRRGGSFIAKQYTCFETLTWGLIIVYACLFDEFYLCKPLTSRPYNSEIYLVGKGFRGLSPVVRSVLIERLEAFSFAPIISADAARILLHDPIERIEAFAQLVFGQQERLLSENVALFERYKGDLGVLDAGIRALRHERIAAWLKRYPVGRIKDGDQLPSNDDVAASSTASSTPTSTHKSGARTGARMGSK
jgi:hypothetical protein